MEDAPSWMMSLVPARFPPWNRSPGSGGFGTGEGRPRRRLEFQGDKTARGAAGREDGGPVTGLEIWWEGPWKL